MDILFWIFLVSFSFTVLYTLTHKQRPSITNEWLEFFNISCQFSAGILILLYILQISATPSLFFASGFLLNFLYLHTSSVELSFKLAEFEEKKPDFESDNSGDWVVILIFAIGSGVLSFSFLFNGSYGLLKWGGWIWGSLILLLIIFGFFESKKKHLFTLIDLINGILYVISIFLITYFVNVSLNDQYSFTEIFSNTHFEPLNELLVGYNKYIVVKLLFWSLIVAFLFQLIRISKNSVNQNQKNSLRRIRKKQPSELISKKSKIKSQATVIPKRIVNDIENLPKPEKKLFYQYFFSLMGKISSIDGDVSIDEINTVESMMKLDLNLNGLRFRQGKNLFKKFQNDETSVEEIAENFKNSFLHNNNIINTLIESLLRMAYSDGNYDEKEEAFIKAICRILDISNEEYERVKTQYHFETIIIKLLKEIDFLPDNDNIIEIKRKLKILFDSIHSPFLVTVLGEFSSGKSTFINALIDKKLLAMKVRPTTAAITKLHYGNENRLEVKYNDGSMKTFEKTDLHALTVENYVDEQDILNDIHYVSLSVDDDLLRNIDIADTPGFNSNNTQHTKITSNFVAYADAIIWLFDANQMAKKSTFNFIEEYCKYEKPIGIINKVDQIDKDEYEEIIPDFIKALESHTNGVFAISSKLALNSNDTKRVASGINSVRDYFIKDVIPSAVKNKSKITLIKLIQILILLNEEKRNIADYIHMFENKIDQFEIDSNKYENRLENHNKSTENFEFDMSNNDVTYYDILVNIKNYFIGRDIPETIVVDTNILIVDFRNLEKDNSKINEWGPKIDKNELVLMNNLNSIKTRWKKYNWSFLGGKSLLDSLLGDVTQEKKILNRDSNNWDNKRDRWFEECDKFNEFLQKTNKGWERLNTLLINFGNKLSTIVFENADEINIESERLNNLYDQLVKDNDLYEEKLDYNHIFESDILEISNEISQLFNLQDNKAENKAFEDFETLINNLKRQQIKHKKLGDKKVYHREKISEVYIVGKKDSVYISSDKKYSNDLQEDAPKIT
jgi:GTPase Era involved in 16S rRNA processing/uncharacterized tellurite resistance protein B-like protein